MGITREHVFDVADQLEQDGIVPTQLNVRERLGGGSFSTIQPALAEWRALRLERSAAVEPMPENLLVLSKQMADAAWRLALTAAESILVTERNALRAANALIEQERADLGTWADGLGSELALAREKVLQGEKHLKAQVEETDALRMQLSASQASLVQCEKHLELERQERRGAQQSLMETREEVAKLTVTARA